MDYPITKKDIFYTGSIIIGIFLLSYGKIGNSAHGSFYVEFGKIMIYGGITIFLTDRMIKLFRKSS